MFAIALVQDDFFDKADKRGELDASHKRYTPEIAIASSNYCYVFAINMLKELERFDIPREIIDGIYNNFINIQKIVFESFLMELLNKASLEFTTEDVLTLHRAKTIHGTLTLYSVGMIIDSIRETNIADKIKSYSYNIAIAGQIKNDIYDMTRYAKTRGYVDILNGYLTYPLAKLKEVLNKEELVYLKRLFENKNAEKIVELLHKKRIFEICAKDCKKYAEMSDDSLDKIFGEELAKILKLWIDGNSTINIY